MDKVTMDICQILATLPHRYPFLLVDRVLELDPGKRIVAIKNVTMNEPQFTGHWPENPVMPGVLMLEAMAQVGGVFLLSEADTEGKQAFFGGIDGVRFRRQVVPGDQLVITAELTRRKGGIGKVHIEARVEGEIAVEGEFMFALADKEEQVPAGGSGT